MRAAIIVGMAALVGACASPPPAAETPASVIADQQANASPDIGKNFWIETPLEQGLCSRPDIKSCQAFSKGRAHIEGVEFGYIRPPNYDERPSYVVFYRVTIDDGRTGYVVNKDLLAHATTTDPTLAAECQRRGEPRVGMTAAQVARSCWGKPDHISRTQAGGAVENQYVYGDGRSLNLRNGVVTSIQISATPR